MSPVFLSPLFWRKKKNLRELKTQAKCAVIIIYSFRFRLIVNNMVIIINRRDLHETNIIRKLTAMLCTVMLGIGLFR